MFDFIVIGGGIVGLATARALRKQEPAARIIVLEAEGGLAQHQSGRNSGVVHAGVYYRPGSLKATLCREGVRTTKEYCLQRGLPYEQCGKLIVASNDVEMVRMEELHRRALAHGLLPERISKETLRELEPNVAGAGALLVRDTAITDYAQLCVAMADELRDAGVEIELSRPVVGIRELPGWVELETPQGALLGRRMIACAGVQSDRIARAAGLRPSCRMIPFRGEYYELGAARSDLVRHLIYPVPDPELPFLGVHLTRHIGGALTVGPNAVLALGRRSYRKLSVNPKDLADTLTFSGFWKLLSGNWQAGLDELWSSASRRHFLARSQKLCPSLQLCDLARYRVGIRAQAVDPRGALVDDFLFAQTDRMLHVLNAPSPAATSAIPIGGMIASRMRR